MGTCGEHAGTRAEAGGSPLYGIYVNPTKYCNLRCRHCWLSPPVKESVEDDPEMTAEEINGIIGAAADLGASYVKFTGGEPMLREDIGEMLAFCRSRGLRVDMETNGTLIDARAARMLRENGISFISVSLDSHDPARNDSLRGKKGAFDGAVSGIKALVEEGFCPQVIMSLYRENLRDLALFFELMKGLSVRNVKINTIAPLGRGAGLVESGGTPSVKEVLDLSKALEPFREDFPGTIYLDFPMAFRGLADLKNGQCGFCNIRGILGILSDGSVSMCGIGVLEKELIFGNVRRVPSLLGEIWRGHPFVKSIKEDLPRKLKGVCGICVLRNSCLGYCRAEAYHGTGDVFAPYWFCQAAYDEGLFPSTRLIPEPLRTR